MEITLAMRVLDAMASELEAIKSRIEMAEAAIRDLQSADDCSCKTWQAHTHGPKDGKE